MLEPLVDLSGIRVGRAALVVLMTMNREVFELFPALDRADIALEVGGNLLPRVETRPA
jgi:hypothetical protein